MTMISQLKLLHTVDDKTSVLAVIKSIIKECITFVSIPIPRGLRSSLLINTDNGDDCTASFIIPAYTTPSVAVFFISVSSSLLQAASRKMADRKKTNVLNVRFIFFLLMGFIDITAKG